jgi:hypothetical protein
MMGAVTESRRRLSFAEVEDALAALVGERVSVRIVERAAPERLVAVLDGILREPTAEKTPSRFWPLDEGLVARDRAAERFGIVLHEDAFDVAEARAGGTVVVVAQGQVLVNVRRLETHRGKTAQP